MTKTTKGDRKGQALAELGIIVTVLITITLGAVEFGYTFFALHMVTQATAAGARAASVLQVGSRGVCGQITDPTLISDINDLVRTQVGSVATVTNVQVVQVPNPGTTFPCSPATAMPKVKLIVDGTIPSIFGLRKSTGFERIETFRDEGR